MTTLQVQAEAVHAYDANDNEQFNAFKATLDKRQTYEAVSGIVAYCKPKNGREWTAAQVLSLLDLLTY
jgi:hypothetical protein